MTLTAPGSIQADSSAGGPVAPCPARGLVCRNCGATFGLIAEHACAECFGPLEQSEPGPPNSWGYAGLHPGGQVRAVGVSPDPDLTPLIRDGRLAAELG